MEYSFLNAAIIWQIFKSRPMHFYTSFNDFRDINVSNFLPSKVSQGHEVHLSQWCHSIANDKIYKNLPIKFCARSNYSSNINISNFLPSKSKSRSQNTIFAMMPFDGKYPNVVFFNIFLFSLRYDKNDFTTQTHTSIHTHTHTHKNEQAPIYRQYLADSPKNCLLQRKIWDFFVCLFCNPKTSGKQCQNGVTKCATWIFFHPIQCYNHSIFSADIETKYDGKLSKELSGPDYEIISRIMKVLVNKKITVPGSFRG